LIGNGRIARYQRRSTPVTKASFSRSVGVVFPFWASVGGSHVHMHIALYFMYLCIIDCICIICFRDVLPLYTLITMICWIWAYDFASDAHVMHSYALGSFRVYMLVDGFPFVKMLYDPLLWVECLLCSDWVLMEISCLICAWNHVLFIWDQRLIYHHECLAYMLPCGEA
jgi:hypothetical protein